MKTLDLKFSALNKKKVSLSLKEYRANRNFSTCSVLGDIYWSKTLKEVTLNFNKYHLDTLSYYDDKYLSYNQWDLPKPFKK